MPQRWLQQKLLKQKRMRRAYLKRLPSAGIDVAKQLAYEIFQNKQRVASIRHGEPMQKGTFMQDVPKTAKVNPQVFFDAPRTGVSARLYEIKQNDWQQKLVEYNKIVLKKTDYSTVYMYFSGDEYMLVKEKGATLFTSKVYSDKHLLQQAFKLNLLSWFKVD